MVLLRGTLPYSKFDNSKFEDLKIRPSAFDFRLFAFDSFYSSHLRNTRQALWPPKPKVLVSA